MQNKKNYLHMPNLLKRENIYEYHLYNILCKYISQFSISENMEQLCKFTINIRYFENLFYTAYKLIEMQLKLFSDLLIIDYPMLTVRFQSIYNIISTIHNFRFIIKVPTNLDIDIPSITTLYPCASWFERESWDLFGIYYYNNLDLRRISNDYGFSGHPMRKDFPLSGYYEVAYNIFFDLILYDFIKMSQEFRFYSNVSPWKSYNINV